MGGAAAYVLLAAGRPGEVPLTTYRRRAPREEPSVVRLPAAVTERAYFDVDPGTVLDLTGSRFVATGALNGLVELARRGPVCLILEGGPVMDKLRRVFHNRLRHCHGAAWELAL